MIRGRHVNAPGTYGLAILGKYGGHAAGPVEDARQQTGAFRRRMHHHKQRTRKVGRKWFQDLLDSFNRARRPADQDSVPPPRLFSCIAHIASPQLFRNFLRRQRARRVLGSFRRALFLRTLVASTVKAPGRLRAERSRNTSTTPSMRLSMVR